MWCFDVRKLEPFRSVFFRISFKIRKLEFGKLKVGKPDFRKIELWSTRFPLVD